MLPPVRSPRGRCGPGRLSAAVLLRRFGIPLVVARPTRRAVGHRRPAVRMRAMELFRQWGLETRCAPGSCHGVEPLHLLREPWAAWSSPAARSLGDVDWAHPPGTAVSRQTSSRRRSSTTSPPRRAGAPGVELLHLVQTRRVSGDPADRRCRAEVEQLDAPVHPHVWRRGVLDRLLEDVCAIRQFPAGVAQSTSPMTGCGELHAPTVRSR